MKGICKLCSNHDGLKKSHLIPKFVYRWMRKTGGNYFRNAADPKKRIQDGTKEYMLCGACEQRFSEREAYFKKNILDVYEADQNSPIVYDERLFYFIISISWRTLVHENTTKLSYNQLLSIAEEEWREYLLTGSIPQTYNKTHLFFTGIFTEDTQPVKNFNLYFNRATDATVGFNSKICFVYWKFLRFLSFSEITPFDKSLWENTLISPSGGIVRFPQEIKDGVANEFMVDRSTNIVKVPLTEKQKKFHDDKILSTEFVGSDLDKVLKADANSSIDPHILYPTVGCNEVCPCGSGKKYKECHRQ